MDKRAAKYIDKYEVLGEIGRGGMGAVYKAVHPQFKKYVALKEVNSELMDDPEVQRQFELEAELLAQIPPHPNVVMVRDALVWRNQLYLVMDYIDGVTLDPLLKDGVTVEHGVELLDQILSGLEAIHRSGIVHRDLKPANILIDRQGIPHISDFGIAGRLGRRTILQLRGTAKYAAPELIDSSLGRSEHEHQIDIYSLGVTAYEMFLGERRFREQFPEVYAAHGYDQNERWVAWHEDVGRSARNLNDIDLSIPRAIGNLVGCMMAKNVGSRYRSAGDARRDLSAWFGATQDMRARRAGPPADDVTAPLDQLRAERGRTGRSSAASRLRHPAPLRPEPPLHSGFESGAGNGEVAPATPARSSKPLPRWGWYAGMSAALVFVLVVVLVQALYSYPGFTLIVKGAPPGSEVYIDDTRVGIPTGDGSIKAFGLAAGGRRSVRVYCQRCEEVRELISAKDGEEIPLTVSLKCEGEFPAELDYNGAMIFIEAGDFIMGDDSHEPNERPSHHESLPAYYIDKFEVSNREFARFCQAAGQTYSVNHPFYQQYFKNSPDSPVLGLSWESARAYAQWAGKRLPSEREWEKAASWDKNTKAKRQWPWGSSPDAARANLLGRLTGESGQDRSSPWPSPVGRFPAGASAYGVQDMVGNASEWVEDDYLPYAESYKGADEKFGTGLKVVRGGGFTHTIENARTSFREGLPPDQTPHLIVGPNKRDEQKTTIGFRCAVSANDPKLLEHIRKRRVKQ